MCGSFVLNEQVKLTLEQQILTWFTGDVRLRGLVLQKRTFDLQEASVSLEGHGCNVWSCDLELSFPFLSLISDSFESVSHHD